MDIHSLVAVVYAVVFVGVLFFARYYPYGVMWRLRVDNFDMDIVRDTVQKIGLFLGGVGVIRGLVDGDISLATSLALIILALLLCFGSAYQPRRRL